MLHGLAVGVFLGVLQINRIGLQAVDADLVPIRLLVPIRDNRNKFFQSANSRAGVKNTRKYLTVKTGQPFHRSIVINHRRYTCLSYQTTPLIPSPDLRQKDNFLSDLLIRARITDSVSPDCFCFVPPVPSIAPRESY